MATEQVKPRTGQVPLRAVPVRHPWRWLATAVVLVLAAMLAHSLVLNPRFDWDIVGQYVLSGRVLNGLVGTLWLTAAAMAMGIVGGVLLAVMRLSPNPLLAGASWLYIWFFRGTPVLVQILFWGFIASLYPQLGLGVPFGPQFVTFSANDVITIPVAAVLGLGLNEAAYMAEIVRAGILSVDEGQGEAAQALGMHRSLVMRRIVLPQAMRVIIPPTGNETIGMLKTTSLVSFIGMTELLYSVQLIYAVNFRQIPLLLAAVLWYLLLTSVLTVGQYYVERHFGRGTRRGQQQPMFNRLFGNLSRTGGTPAPVDGGSRR